MFYDNIKGIWTDDAVEEIRGDWYIKVGFCGFNSYANNLLGYANRAAAEAAIKYYQSKSDHINSIRPAA